MTLALQALAYIGMNKHRNCILQEQWKYSSCTFHLQVTFLVQVVQAENGTPCDISVLNVPTVRTVKTFGTFSTHTAPI